MTSGSSSGTAFSSSASVSSFAKASDSDSNKPLWAYVTISQARQHNATGGNIRWSCNFCKLEFTGSYTRIKSHLLRLGANGIRKCGKVTDVMLGDLKKIVSEAEDKAQPQNVPLPPASNMVSESRKRRGGVGALEKAFKVESRAHLSSEIARMFYSAGLPFHLARNVHYVNSYTYAANQIIDGFIPPGYNALRTTLLERERENIEHLLQPIKARWKESGISLVSDGWTDAQRRPLINFMAAAEEGAVFLKAVDGSSEYKDKHYIAKLMLETVNEVGAQNVVQIITDNAPVCKAAGQIVEAQHPSIFWTPCVVHTLNLALKNICAAKNTEKNQDVFTECGWITQIAEDAIFIKNFVMNHAMRLAIFNQYVPLKLLSVAETRFASTIVMLKRFKLIKRGLQNMVIGDDWGAYREDDIAKAQSVKDFILNDLWWDKIDYILSFTEPIYEMLRQCDTDKSSLHLVYDMWDTMIEKVKGVIFRYEGLEPTESSRFYDVVHDVLVDRWTKSCSPLHCLAHSLNPTYYSNEWLSGGQNRVAPHRDTEISEERIKCLRRYFPNGVERTLVSTQFAKFAGNLPPFNALDSMSDRGNMEPKIWWISYGNATPELQSIALKLLGQPCSSSCCERNWSTYSFIHSIRRNKLHPKRAEDLVYIHTNLRLLSRKSDDYKAGPSKMWDIGGDDWDSLSGAGILEVASLSLDEPDIEAMLFTDDGEGNEEIENFHI